VSISHQLSLELTDESHRTMSMPEHESTVTKVAPSSQQQSPLLSLPTELRFKIFEQVILDFIPPFYDFAALRASTELWRRAAEQRSRNRSPPMLATCRQMHHDGKTVWIDCLRTASESLREQRELVKLQLSTFDSDMEKSEIRDAHEELLLLTCMAFGASRALEEVLVGKKSSSRPVDSVHGPKERSDFFGRWRRDTTA